MLTKTTGVFFILIFLAIAFSFKDHEQENKMNPFNWLTGSWTMKTGRGTIIESWTHLNDSTIGGESILIKTTGGTDTREKLRFIHSNKEYYYCAIAIGQNNEQEIKFKITSFTDSSFVAENREHDFPKRIIYNRVTKDSIYAYVDSGPSTRKLDFYYSRNKN